MIASELEGYGSYEASRRFAVLLVAGEEPACRQAALGSCLGADGFDHRRLAYTSYTVQDEDGDGVSCSPLFDVLQELLASVRKAFSNFACHLLAIMGS